MTSYTNDENFKIRTTIGEITLIYDYMNITDSFCLDQDNYKNIILNE